MTTDEELQYHYSKILSLLGEDPQREGLIKTPERVGKAMRFLTQGMTQSPHEILRSAMFKEDYRQMVIVKDIDFPTAISRDSPSSRVSSRSSLVACRCRSA